MTSSSFCDKLTSVHVTYTFVLCHTRAATANGTTDPEELNTDQKIKIGGIIGGAVVILIGAVVAAIITTYKCCGSKFTFNSFS